MRLILAVIICFCIATACNEPQQGESAADSSQSLDTVAVDTSKNEIRKATPSLEQAMLDAGLVDVQSLSPEITVDLKYSTTDNFLETDVYGDLVRAYLRPKAAEKLAKAQEALTEIKPGYSLLVFDGARPRSVQYMMWDIVDLPDKKNYVADPNEGSIHNYGMAVDLSIADDEGNPLDMGTKFDFFGPLAQPQLEDRMLFEGKLNEEQVQNRELLRKVMRKGGFYGIETEWWHFVADFDKNVRANYKMIE